MWRAAVLFGVPVLLAAVVAVPLGLWRGPYQWLCAAVAIGLVVPPGLATLVATERLLKSSPYAKVGAIALGTGARLLVGGGGALLVFVLSKPIFHADPVSFWLWILGAYLTTLVVETTLLAKSSTTGEMTGRDS